MHSITGRSLWFFVAANLILACGRGNQEAVDPESLPHSHDENAATQSRPTAPQPAQALNSNERAKANEAFGGLTNGLENCGAHLKNPGNLNQSLVQGVQAHPEGQHDHRAIYDALSLGARGIGPRGMECSGRLDDSVSQLSDLRSRGQYTFQSIVDFIRLAISWIFAQLHQRSANPGFDFPMGLR